MLNWQHQEGIFHFYNFVSAFFTLELNFVRYDLHSGIIETAGNHNDMASCIGYSSETSKLSTKLTQNARNAK